MARKVAFFLPGVRGGAIDRAQDTVKETTLPALQCHLCIAKTTIILPRQAQ
eukprot:COSAG01_NODE_28134_length_668_cov_0.910369_1_plen_50_part_01